MTQNHKILETVATAIQDVETYIDTVLASSGKAEPAIRHLVKSGGKRVRPLLAILGAGTVSPLHIPQPVIPIAAAAELVHTASLLHDDVIDESDLRRGKETARLIFSNEISVLAGDHCLASAVKLIHQADKGEVLLKSLDMIQDLTTGELIQLDVQGRLDTSQELYEDICYRKTAALFVWAAQSGALLAGGQPEQLEAFEVMARSMGIAFQVADDLLDFVAEEATFGKNIMDDVKDGRLTLPLIIALQQESGLATLLEEAFASPSSITTDMLTEIRRYVIDSGAIKVVQERVDTLTQEAINAVLLLPENGYRAMIMQRLQQLAARNA